MVLVQVCSIHYTSALCQHQ